VAAIIKAVKELQWCFGHDRLSRSENMSWRFFTSTYLQY